jgi:hypothetical protein
MMSVDKSDSVLNDLSVYSHERNQSKTNSKDNTVHVKSYFRRHSKSFQVNVLKKSTSPKHSIGQHLMDPATFKLVLDTQKENLADVKERQKRNKSNLRHKNEWKTFFSTKKKRRRGKPRFVWETKRIKQEKAEMEFIKSINNLKIPMETDYIRDKSQYQISNTKRGMGSDNDPDLVAMSKKTVDFDSKPEGDDTMTIRNVIQSQTECPDSEPEGDDTMTIASLFDGANITIDSPQRTQTESPTQLFPDSDHSDDDDVGEFMFEE